MVYSAATYAASATDLIGWAVERFGKKLAVCTSFQKEGMIVLDMAVRLAPDINVFTLDTGRLPEETYQMIETVRERYGIAVEIVCPDPAEVQTMVQKHGANLFYREVAMRRLCCEVRKVRPLERRLATLDAWITGLRRGQTEARAEVPMVEENTHPLKLNPLADWTDAQVEAYLREHDVPVHPLYALGYGSIGCEPCTRAGEGRSGRWWWEQETAKECGIHFSAGGRVERRVDVLLREVLPA